MYIFIIEVKMDLSISAKLKPPNINQTGAPTKTWAHLQCRKAFYWEIIIEEVLQCKIKEVNCEFRMLTIIIIGHIEVILVIIKITGLQTMVIYRVKIPSIHSHIKRQGWNLFPPSKQWSCTLIFITEEWHWHAQRERERERIYSVNKHTVL